MRIRHRSLAPARDPVRRRWAHGRSDTRRRSHLPPRIRLCGRPRPTARCGVPGRAPCSGQGDLMCGCDEDPRLGLEQVRRSTQIPRSSTGTEDHLDARRPHIGAFVRRGPGPRPRSCADAAGSQRLAGAGACPAQSRCKGGSDRDVPLSLASGRGTTPARLELVPLRVDPGSRVPRRVRWQLRGGTADSQARRGTRTGPASRPEVEARDIHDIGLRPGRHAVGGAAPRRRSWPNGAANTHSLPRAIAHTPRRQGRATGPDRRQALASTAEVTQAAICRSGWLHEGLVPIAGGAACRPLRIDSSNSLRCFALGMAGIQ